MYGYPGIAAALRRPDYRARMHLRFDGEGAVFRDLTGQTITAQGNTTHDGTNTKFLGKSGAFDGTGDYLQLGTKANLDFMHQVGQGTGDGANTQWSLMLRYRCTNYGAHRYLYDTANNNVSYTGVTIRLYQNTRSLRVLIANGSGTAVCTLTGSAVPNDTSGWHYLVVTYDQGLASDNLKTWVDGTSMGTATKTAQTPSSGTSYGLPTLGATVGGSNAFIGNLDELIILTGVCIDGSVVPSMRR